MKQWSSTSRYFAGVLLLVFLVGFVYYAREAIKPLVVSAFIAYLFNPAAVYLAERTRLSRRAAVMIVYFTAIILLFAVPISVTPFFLDELAGIGRDLFRLLGEFQAALAEPLVFMGMSLDMSELGQALGGLRTLLITPLPADAFRLLESTTKGTLWFLVIVVSVYLFLAYWPAMRDWLFSLASDSAREEVQTLYNQVRSVWMAYLRGQILLMFLVGVIFTIAWYILGIPGAFVLGVIAGLFTLVPDLGPIAAIALTMAVSLLEGSTWIPLDNIWVTVIVFLVYFVLINIKNMWLRPVIMGRSVHMNEGVVFVVILVATVLVGILGALLVVPVLASGAIILNYLIRKVLGQHPFEKGTPFVRPIARPQEPESIRRARRFIKKHNRN
jgi:predicted PurR-regulated permease PerM